MGKFDCPECGKRFNHKLLRSCDVCQKSFPVQPEFQLSNEGSSEPLSASKVQAVLDRTKDELLMFRLLQGSEHRGVCDIDESIRFRCEKCMDAERAESDAHERLRRR